MGIAKHSTSDGWSGRSCGGEVARPGQASRRRQRTSIARRGRPRAVRRGRHVRQRRARSGHAAPLLAQLGPDDELIVVDNASSDGTAERVRALAPARGPAAQERNVGFAAGCNAGAGARRRRPARVPEPRRGGRAPGSRTRSGAPLEDRGWAAWMGAGHWPDGGAVNTSGGVVHFTGIAWAGQVGEPVERRRARRARSRSRPAPAWRCRASAGATPAASRRTTSCTARTSTCRCGCGCGAGAWASSRRRGSTTTTRSRRARTSGGCSSATARPRSPHLPGAAARAARAGAAGHRAGAAVIAARGGWGAAEAAGARRTRCGAPAAAARAAGDPGPARVGAPSSRGC